MELFDEPCGNGEQWFARKDAAGFCIIAGLYSNAGADFFAPPFKAPHLDALRLFELSVNAFDAIVHAGMSELPITAEIARFEQKVLAAARSSAVPASTPRGEVDAALATAMRQAADRAATDRGDGDVCTVLDAAYKVRHEVHRLMGLLRFCPDAHGIYIAHCEPDHFVLPAFAPHFKERFGQTPWAIIDEKRRLCVRCLPGSGLAGPIEFFALDKNTATLPIFSAGARDDQSPPPDGEWGNLWRHYHKTINNESRNNPGLQRRFMPQRYWKYLTEV